jgi:antitoxin MazE
MDKTVKTKLVRIGNSRGIRIPKPLLEQAGLVDEVRLRVVETGIVIEAPRTERAGWADAAALVRERGEDGLLDQPTPTAFDEEEWVWE